MEVVAPRLNIAAATPPTYESAHVQNAWMYPRRVNMVANPRVQEDDPGVHPFWRSSVTPGSVNQYIDTFERANGAIGGPWLAMPNLHPNYQHVPFTIASGGLVNAADVSGNPHQQGTAYWPTEIMRTQFVEIEVSGVGYETIPGEGGELENAEGLAEYDLYVQYDPTVVTGASGYVFSATFYHPNYYPAGERPNGALVWGIYGPGPLPELDVPEASVPITLTKPWALNTHYTLRMETVAETGEIKVFLDGVLLATTISPALGGHHVGYAQRWSQFDPSALSPRIEQVSVGSLVAGTTLGKCVWETNEMDGRTGFWTVQFQAKGTGYLKVGLVFWHADDPTEIDIDWGHQTWLLSAGAWTHINCLRFSTDTSTVQLRIELMGSDLEIDYVCCEPGALLGWEYFDGDTVYGAPDDHSWWGPDGTAGERGAAYSGWYDNKRNVNGVVFDSTFLRETPGDLAPPPPEGAVYAKWGHTPTFYSYWQDANSGAVNPLWGPQPGTLLEARSVDEIDQLLAADLHAIDSSISERRSGTVYRWLPAGTKIMAHWNVMRPHDLRLPPVDVSGSPPRSYNLVTYPAQYLVPTVGTATTTHALGPLPDQATFVCQLRGPTSGIGTIAARYEVDPDRSWLLQRNATGTVTLTISPNGTAGSATTYTVVGPAPTGADEWLAVARNNNGVTFVLTVYTSTDGVSWTQAATSSVASAGMAFEGNSPVRIGAYAVGSNVWNGRIHYVRLLNGSDPYGTSAVWIFDADDYLGQGLIMTDPRAREWTLTAATAIQPARPVPGVDDPWVGWTPT